MASQGTSTREEESRLSLRTLVIASLASAVAAIVTSQFWVAGTPVAAALTPVIVTLVSELLHKPTQAIAARVTTERTALLPDAAGAGPPPEPKTPREGEAPRAPEAPPVARDLEGEPGPMRVYRPRQQRRRIHWRVVAITTLLAFAIGAAALTLPELISGQSFGKGDRNTTIFGGGKDGDRAQETPEPQTTQPQEAEPDQPEEPQETTEQPPAAPAPEEEPTETTEQPPATVPTTPAPPAPPAP
jgi:hypothetical protein